MRIKEMIQREDFYDILKNTMVKYYREVEGRDVSFSYEKIDGQSLIINTTLGFISTFPAPPGLRTFLLGEYNVRGSSLKYIAGKAAALLFSCVPQIGQSKRCYLSQAMVRNNEFIYPQNRSIRVFDYDSMQVDCILKTGFTSIFFNNQLEFRNKYHYDFLNPLINCGDGWFREPILLGHPLARVTDNQLYEYAISRAIVDLSILATDTKRKVDAKEYYGSLILEIRQKLQRAIEQKRISTYDLTNEMVDAIELRGCSLKELEICTTHGDFQSGNIWVDQEKQVWIYDWETVGQRSVWYDIAVLEFSLRRSYGWYEFWKSSDIEKIRVLDSVVDRNSSEIETIKRIVALEDILFYLDDMLELPSNWGNKIFDANMINLTKAIIG